MKKIAILACCIAAAPLLHALPVGNPSEANLLSKGVAWGTNPELNWGGHFGLRAGYYGDFVFNRHTKVEQNVVETNLSYTNVYTNAGYVALNLYNCVDFFSVVGMSNLFLDGDAATFGSSAIGQRIEIESHTDFSWGVGARVSLVKYREFTLGVEGQYFYTDPDIRRITQAATFSAYPSGFEMKYSEWQVGAGLSYRLNLAIPIIPYAAIEWSTVKINMNEAVPGGSFDVTLYNLKEQREIGYAVGVSFADSEQFALTIEGRFVNEKALYANAQLRF
jgi:major outer membrane protein